MALQPEHCWWFKQKLALQVAASCDFSLELCMPHGKEEFGLHVQVARVGVYCADVVEGIKRTWVFCGGHRQDHAAEINGWLAG